MSLFTRFVVLAVAAHIAAATNNCSNDSFFFGTKSCCVKNNGHTTPDACSPPAGTTCPNSSGSWYWSKSKSYCVPSAPGHENDASCPSGYDWHLTNSCCTKTVSPAPSNSCTGNDFWWQDKSCCLPKGGPPSTPQCPSGSKCPSDHYWHSGLGCCAPKNPPPASPPSPPNSPPSKPPPSTPPSCPAGWNWLSHIWQCQPSSPPPTVQDSPPPPQSSNVFHRRNAKKSRSTSLCPKSLEACPIKLQGGLLGDYECLDTKVELESCGGCASTGKGLDCTTIEGVWNVSCDQGSCAVYSCRAGYKVAADGKSCAKL